MPQVTMPLRQAALAALAAAAMTLGVATYRAARLDPLPLPSVNGAATGAAPMEGAPAGATVHVAAGDAAGEMDNDPFDPERQLPQEAEAPAADAADEALPTPVPPAAVRVLGVVVLPEGGGFVVYQLPSEVPKTVRIGGSVGRLTLVGVEPGRAIFRASDGARIALDLTTGT